MVVPIMAWPSLNWNSRILTEEDLNDYSVNCLFVLYRPVSAGPE